MIKLILLKLSTLSFVRHWTCYLRFILVELRLWELWQRSWFEINIVLLVLPFRLHCSQNSCTWLIVSWAICISLLVFWCTVILYLFFPSFKTTVYNAHTCALFLKFSAETFGSCFVLSFGGPVLCRVARVSCWFLSLSEDHNCTFVHIVLSVEENRRASMIYRCNLDLLCKPRVVFERFIWPSW